ncbi:MAG: hypothetical protein Q7U01_08005, partial [Pseudomonas sp.]|nr:hypothetical protein [Pseudomonas sp.]
MARIYRTATMGEAHKRVAIITEHGMADLLVHRVSSVGLAGGSRYKGLFAHGRQSEDQVWFS